MKYKVQQITRDYHSFQDIEECTWDFTLSEVHTDKGTLKIIGFQEVEQNGQVGIQMNVNGYMEIGKYTSNSSQVAKIQTLAIMRRPHNVWLWVYLFNEFDQPIAAFCGTDGFDDNNSFAKYINELKRKAEGGIADKIEDICMDSKTTDFISAKEKVENVILNDGKKYNGWGYYNNNTFIPHGAGKKFYSDFYVYGNFRNGILDGPAINSHDYYMYTMFFKNNRGNGWGLNINGGYLAEFGYYENSQLKTDLTDLVQWYYEGILSKSDRHGESMMAMYTSKETKEVTTLLIGYAPKKVSEDLTLSCMGFRFNADGSVWVGTGNRITMTGSYIHFRPDGCIDIGKFQNNTLIGRMSLHDFIDSYFGISQLDEEDILTSLSLDFPKTSYQRQRESEREKYRNIQEPKIDFSYFTGKYNKPEIDDLPF